MCALGEEDFSTFQPILILPVQVVKLMIQAASNLKGLLLTDTLKTASGGKKNQELAFY